MNCFQAKVPPSFNFYYWFLEIISRNFHLSILNVIIGFSWFCLSSLFSFMNQQSNKSYGFKLDVISKPDKCTLSVFCNSSTAKEMRSVAICSKCLHRILVILHAKRWCFFLAMLVFAKAFIKPKWLVLIFSHFKRKRMLIMVYLENKDIIKAFSTISIFQKWLANMGWYEL